MSMIADVMKYFRDHPDTIVYLSDLESELDAEQGPLRNAVNNARNAHADFNKQLEIVVRGDAWRYKPAKKPTVKKQESTRVDDADDNSQMFETIGHLKDGSVLIKRDDGKIFRAVEL